MAGGGLGHDGRPIGGRGGGGGGLELVAPFSSADGEGAANWGATGRTGSWGCGDRLLRGRGGEWWWRMSKGRPGFIASTRQWARRRTARARGRRGLRERESGV